MRLNLELLLFLIILLYFLLTARAGNVEEYNMNEKENYNEAFIKIAQDVLYNQLIKLGLKPVKLKNRLKIGLGELSCEFTIYDFDSHEQFYNVGIGIQIFEKFTDTEGILVYQMGNGGPSPENAIKNAVFQWIETVLEPIANIFDKDRWIETGNRVIAPYSLMTHKLFSDSIQTWKVIPGEIYTISYDGDDKKSLLLKKQVKSSEFSTSFWIKPFADLIDQNKLDNKSIVWMKYFLMGQKRHGAEAGEVKLNNQDWPEALNILSTYKWPELSASTAFKQFIIIKRTEKISYRTKLYDDQLKLIKKRFKSESLDPMTVGVTGKTSLTKLIQAYDDFYSSLADSYSRKTNN